MNARRYIGNVIRPVALPVYVKIIGEETLCTNMTMSQPTVNFLAAHRFQVFDWSPLSPDMSPIEHIEDELGQTKKSSTSVTEERK